MLRPRQSSSRGAEQTARLRSSAGSSLEFTVLEATSLKRNLFSIWFGAFLILSSLAPRPATAQAYGQWWWTGNVGLGQRAYIREANGIDSSEFKESYIDLDVGIEGFILHPMIASFNVGTNFRLLRTEGGGRDSNLVGFNGEVAWLPRGAFPGRVYASQQSFDFFDPLAADPLLPLRLPDTVLNYGISQRLRRGLLSGTVFGLSRSEIDYVDPRSGSDEFDRAFVDWQRTLGRFNNALRIERRSQSYNALELEIANNSVVFTERARLSDLWRWNGSVNGLQFRRLSERTKIELDTLRARNQVLRRNQNRSLLELRHDFSASQDRGKSSSVRGNNLGISYRWFLGAGWNVGPFASYGVVSESGGQRTTQRPAGGVTVSWSRQAGKLQATANGRFGYGVTKTEFEDESLENSGFVAAANASISRTWSKRNKLGMEGGLFRNDLRDETLYVPGLPQFDIPILLVGVQDGYRLRLLTSRSGRAGSLDGYIQWSARRNTRNSDNLSDDLLPDFDSNSITASLQLLWRELTLTGTGGTTSISAIDRSTGNPVQCNIENGVQICRPDPIGSAPEEESHRDLTQFAGLRASWKPIRWLTFRANYRFDQRDLFLLENELDNQRVEVGVSIRIGFVTLEADAFSWSFEVQDGSTRRSDGFRWRLRRGFAGWLPIVSAPQRRGQIR